MSRGGAVAAAAGGAPWAPWPSADTASSQKNPHLSGWGGSAALNALNAACSNSECWSEPLKDFALFLICEFFLPCNKKHLLSIFFWDFLSSAQTHILLFRSLLWLCHCQGLELWAVFSQRV